MIIEFLLNVLLWFALLCVMMGFIQGIIKETLIEMVEPKFKEIQQSIDRLESLVESLAEKEDCEIE